MAGQVMASALFTTLSTGLPVDISGACEVSAGAESACFIVVRKP